MNIRVVLADDHAILREGIAALLEAEDDVTVVGQAADADSTVALCEALGPDVAVVDLSMPGGGLTAIERISAARPDVRVLVLTMHDDPAYLRKVLSAGGAGYLVKAAAGAALIEAVRQVAAGNAFIRLRLGDHQLRAVTQPGQSAGAPLPALSPRERQVVVLLARGLTNREIAARLGIQKKTIDTYRTRLQDKLGLTTRAELFAFVEASGLLDGAKDGL